MVGLGDSAIKRIEVGLVGGEMGLERERRGMVARSGMRLRRVEVGSSIVSDGGGGDDGDGEGEGGNTR